MINQQNIRSAYNNNFANAITAGDPRLQVKQMDRGGMSRGAAQYSAAGMQGAAKMAEGIANAYSQKQQAQDYNTAAAQQTYQQDATQQQALGALAQALDAPPHQQQLPLGTAGPRGERGRLRRLFAVGSITGWAKRMQCAALTKPHQLATPRATLHPTTHGRQLHVRGPRKRRVRAHSRVAQRVAAARTAHMG